MKKINGVVKNYDWGGFDFLPEILNLKKQGQPFAEYWLGTHPDGMAKLANEDKSLATYLDRSLPFLFKILDVRNMLSIQVHPDKKTAERGFALEENGGKPRTAPDRVYKDDNHKPELMVALSEFWLVQGFMTDAEINSVLHSNPELKIIEEYYRENGLAKTYEHLMTMAQDEVNAILKPLGQRIKPLYENNELKKEDINFWAARAFLTYNQKGVCDRGIFSLYLMNLVHLRPGEGIYQAPGVLHAYMEGQNIECMATSDNVIRGGLTSKHIDIPQLLTIVNFVPVKPQVIISREGHYDTPATEFHLCKIEETGMVKAGQPAILMNVGDTATIHFDAQKVILEKGEAAIATQENSIVIEGNVSGLFMAAID